MHPTTWLRQKIITPWAICLWTGLGVAILMIGLRSVGWLESWDLLTYDALLRWQKNDAAEHDNLVIIELTDRNIEALGWPLNDETIAQALKILVSDRPAAIGLDIYRPEDRPPGQAALAEVLKSNPHIIVVRKFPNNETDVEIRPPKILAETDRVGFNDILVDRDGIVRRGLLFLDEGDKPSYSFALRLALLSLAREGITPVPDPVNPSHIRLGVNTIRPLEKDDGGYSKVDARGYQFLLDHRDAKRRIRSYDFESLLSERVRPKSIEGKIVLLGVVSDSVKDDFYLPVRTGSGQRLIRGVELHATIVGQLLRLAQGVSATLRPVNIHWQWLVIFACALLGSQTNYWMRSPLYQFLAVLTGALIIFGAGVLLFARSLWVPIVHPALAWLFASGALLIYRYSELRIERAQVLQLFGTFVSEKVRDTLWQNRAGFIDGGRPRPEGVVATVLFTDMVNFTKIAEKGLAPEMLMTWLNEYMDAMSPCVERYGGFVKQYAGDAIMALFGLPKSLQTEDAIREAAANALHCALAMRATMVELNGRWLGKKSPTVEMRVGISTGPMVVGSLGSQRRLEYTVVGDTVNIAARLESFDKESFKSHPFENPCRILIEETTRNLVKDRFELEYVNEVDLKGKSERVKVYSVVGESKNYRPQGIARFG